MEEEEELMAAADDAQWRKTKTAWKATMAGPPALEASLGAIGKCMVPAVNMPIPVARIDKAFTPVEKKFTAAKSKLVTAAAKAANSFQKEFKRADPSKGDPPALPGRKSSLIAANLQVLLKIDELLDELAVIAKANIPLQNEFKALQRDLKAGLKDAKKEKDKKKPVSVSVLGQTVEVKAGDLPKVVSAADKLGKEMKTFDSQLADLISAWSRDRAALITYGDKLKGFDVRKYVNL